MLIKQNKAHIQRKEDRQLELAGVVEGLYRLLRLSKIFFKH